MRAMPFIVFDGLDGSGKSSLIHAFEEVLQKNQIAFLRTREPGGTPIGDQIRELILQHSAQPPTPRTEALLYQASRAQHVDHVIRPALFEKKWVLCDRYTASSLAFQGAARGLALQDIEFLNQFSTDKLEADLTVLLDLSVDVAQKRREARMQKTGEVQDRMESEERDFHEKVRQSFLSQSKQNPGKWLVLNADLPTAALLQELLANLKKTGVL